MTATGKPPDTASHDEPEDVIRFSRSEFTGRMILRVAIAGADDDQVHTRCVRGACVVHLVPTGGDYRAGRQTARLPPPH